MLLPRRSTSRKASRTCIRRCRMISRRDRVVAGRSVRSKKRTSTNVRDRCLHAMSARNASSPTADEQPASPRLRSPNAWERARARSRVSSPAPTPGCRRSPGMQPPSASRSTGQSHRHDEPGDPRLERRRRVAALLLEPDETEVRGNHAAASNDRLDFRRTSKGPPYRSRPAQRGRGRAWVFSLSLALCRGSASAPSPRFGGPPVGPP